MNILQDTPRKKMILLVFTIIIVQIAISAYFLAFEKKGFYADDMYSYGFANSDGLATPIADKNFIIQTNKWIDGKAIQDYLTVSRDEIFSYGGILSVLKKDAHPPLFYFLLHFICSFTPDIFSKWSAFIINSIGFIVIQIYLYRLTLFISRNRFISILTIIFFGLTSASINMMNLFRMYILATGFTVAFTYYALKYLHTDSKEKIITINLTFSFIFLYLSSMTVYIATLFSFFIVLYICLDLLLSKHIKKMFAFGFSMLLSVGLMAVSFPILFIQLTSDQSALSGSVAYPYMLQIRTAIHVIMNGLFGMSTPIFASMLSNYILWTIIALTIIYLILMFLFRKDAWFNAFRHHLRLSIKTILSKSKKYLRTLLPVFLCIITMLLIFAKGLRLYYYRYDGMRYYYILTPFIAMTILVVLFKFTTSKYIQSIMALLFISTSLLFGNKCFLESNFVTNDINSITDGGHVVVVENQSIEFMYHIMDLINSKSFMYTNPKSLASDLPKTSIISKSKEPESLFLLLDIDATTLGSVQEKTLNGITGLQAIPYQPDNEVSDYFRNIPEFNNMEYLGDFSTCYIYRLK